MLYLGPGSKIKWSQLSLAQLVQKLVITVSDHFFDCGPIFNCHTQRMERFNSISRCRTLCCIFWKKDVTISSLSVTISSHIISLRFLLISRRFQITQGNQNHSIWSRKPSCNWESFFILSQKERFTVHRKKSLFHYLLVVGVTNYSTILVITKINIFLFLYFT